MNIDELASQYQKQYNILNAKLDGLKPLLFIYTGNDLALLRRRMKAYYDMACECERIYCLLSYYYEEGFDD